MSFAKASVKRFNEELNDAPAPNAYDASMGGLGLRAAEDQAPAAYTASLLASQPIVQSLVAAPQLPDQAEQGVLNPPTLAALSAALGNPVVEAEVEGLTQKMLTQKIDEQQLNLLHTMLNNQDVRERARLASLSLPHAGDWSKPFF